MIEETSISVDQKQELTNAINKSQILLSYASQEGKDLTEDIVAPLINARNELSNPSGGQLSQADESAFWVAYAELSELVDPVTVSSLQAIREKKDPDSLLSLLLKKVLGSFYNPKAKSAARKTVSKYRRNFLVAMIAMVSIQVYWVVGVELDTDYSKTNITLESLRIELRDQEIRLQTAGSSIFTQRKTKLDTTISKLNWEIEKLKNRKSVISKMLYNWNIAWKWIPDLLNRNADQSADNANDTQRIELHTDFALIAIGKYVLPLLYGLLGAFAFVMRRLSEEIKKLQFIEELKINYNLRIHLGALSGLAIGWFLVPEQISLSALSPLALAFLAGYSVELLFTIMDRLVMKESNK